MPCYYIRHKGIYVLVIIGIYYHYYPSGFKLFPKSAARTHHSTYHHPCQLYISVKLEFSNSLSSILRKWIELIFQPLGDICQIALKETHNLSLRTCRLQSIK